MKFELPDDFSELAPDKRTSLLKDAEVALGEGKEVFFNGEKYTNYDQLRIEAEIFVKRVQPDPDIPYGV